MFHGDRDTTVSVINADFVLGEEHDGDRRPADVTIEQGRVPGGHAYTRSIYHGAGGRPTNEKWIVHQAGHAWSGGHRGGTYTDPQGPDATAEMVRFFNCNPGTP